MRKILLFVLLLGILALVGCQQPCPDLTCPAIPACPTIDCRSCPTEVQTVAEEVEVIKYVCESGKVVDAKEDCLYIPPSNINLVTTNEDDTFILNSSIAPACVYGYQGGSIYFKRGSIPHSIEYQLKEGDEFKTVYLKKQGVYEKTEYFAVCPTCSHGIFKISPDKVYVLRLKFNLRKKVGLTYEEYEEYSNEHLIDTTENSDIMKKVCVSE